MRRSQVTLIEAAGAHSATYSSVGFNGYPPLRQYVIWQLPGEVTSSKRAAKAARFILVLAARLHRMLTFNLPCPRLFLALLLFLTALVLRGRLLWQLLWRCARRALRLIAAATTSFG
jgi:hypothetical protein